MKSIEFYYAIGSRYSYLASSQIASIERDSGCHTEWRPLNSMTLFSLRGANPFSSAPVSGQYDWAYRETDAARWAKHYGIAFVEPRNRIEYDPQQLALAATAAKRLGHAASFSHRLFAAMFADPITRIDLSECTRRAEACGIDAERFRREMANPETATELEQTLRNARDLGVFGVPTFVVDGELFWGNDRIVLLRDRLADGGNSQ